MYMEVARFFRNVENFPLPQSAKISKQDRYWWNDTDRRNRKNREKPIPGSSTNPIWTGMGLNRSLRAEGPVTLGLSHGTANCRLVSQLS